MEGGQERRWRAKPALTNRTIERMDSMAAKPLPDQALLLKLLRYEPETGKLYWRERDISMFYNGPKNSALCMMRSWNGRFANKPAFTARKSHGYLHGSIGGQIFMAHRIIWKMVTGEEPSMIDHINGVPSDNRFCNLRGASASDNCRNSATYKSNSSGAVGVDFLPAKPGQRRAQWRARIQAEGKLITLGGFASMEDAIRVRKSAERRYGFHPNHGRKPTQ